MNRPLIGPSLPTDWNKPRDDANDDAFGPSLPPNFINIIRDVDKNACIASADSEREIESETDVNEREFIGPLPPSCSVDNRYTELPIKPKTEPKHKPKREEWMTVVPKNVAKKLSMKSVTSFSRKTVNTTSDEQTNANDCNDGTDGNRDNQMSELMQSHTNKNKRKVSLLELHCEKNKKNKKEVNSGERVPFDPQTDLAVRCMDARQSRSVIDKAKLLNTRFTKGKTKFL